MSILPTKRRAGSESPETGTEPAAGAPTGDRDPWFDNAKMVLVALVVAGHSWVLLPDSVARHWFYDFLYMWHMPAFVIVTGYLSRSFTWSRRNLSRLVTVVAVPYIVFEAAMIAFRVNVGGEQGFDRLFVDPHWPMWFLAAMFLWRLATPVLTAVPAPLVVAVSVCLLGGLLETEVLDLKRVAAFLPFFALGLVATPRHVDLLRRRNTRVLAAAVLLVAFVGARWVDGALRTEWFYWRSGYADLGVTFAEGALARLGLLVLATVLALSALALVPRRGGWFARLGAASMVVYLFHGFFIRGAEYAGVVAWASERPWLALLVLTAGSLVLALLLAAPPVARRLNVVVDPVGAVRRSESWDLTDWPTLADRPSPVVAPDSTGPRHPLGERRGPVSPDQLW